MGLGKTITCVSLIAATLGSAKAFAVSPRSLGMIAPLPRQCDSPDASHFSGSVWGMPTAEPSTYQKPKAKMAKKQDKMEAEYIRSSRIKTKSRATLIICPLSTVSNWEDQFREHWKGEVAVVGGSGGNCPPATPSQSLAQLSLSLTSTEPETEMKPLRARDGTPLRVYIYHGNARRPEPTFLADFDAVITTFATLASEFSKQSRGAPGVDGDEDDGGSSEGAGGIDFDENGNQTSRLLKAKKGGLKRKKPTALDTSSALQSIHWFRVVLDEAQ